VRAVCELELAPHQERLVAPAAFTVAEGNYEPGSLLRAICADDEPAGVLLVEELRGQGWTTLETSFLPVEDGAEGFWRVRGFTDTGRTLHGEPVFARVL